MIALKMRAALTGLLRFANNTPMLLGMLIFAILGVLCVYVLDNTVAGMFALSNIITLVCWRIYQIT